MKDSVDPRPIQKTPGPVLPPPPGQEKLKSKRARIERQKERAISLNKSPDWFGASSREETEGVKLEDKFESAMSLVDTKKEQVRKNTTSFTGFRELRVKDMLVILGLWFLRLFIPWVENWHEFNLHILIDPSHWANHEQYFAFHEWMVFLGKCLICLGASILVDLINFRYPIYLLIIILYLSAPITGTSIVIILLARVHDRSYYFEWWQISIVIMMWAMSVPFVTFPLQFSCIFHQEENMSRLAHYNWTAIFVFIEALNATFAHWVIPPNCPTSYETLVFAWCLIGLLITILAIEVLSLMRWAKMKIKSLKLSMCKKRSAVANVSTDKAQSSATATKPSTAEALKPENEPPSNLRMKKLVWFVAMLVPVVFTSVVFETFKRIRPEEDWDKHEYISGTSMLICGQCLGVIVVATVLLVDRKFLKKLHRVAIFKPDVLALGLPLIINAAALTVILARYIVLSGLDEGEVILGPIPTDEVSVIEFYNVEYRNRSICVYSEHFSPLKVPPRSRASTVLRDPGGGVINFTVTFDPRTTPPVPAHREFTYEKGIWVTYFCTFPQNDLDGADIQAFYSEALVIRVNGTRDIRPKKEPQVVFINTYVVNPKNFFYNVTSSGKIETFNATLMAIAQTKQYPPGELEITYWTDVINFVLSGAAPPVTIQLQVENYCVYTVLLCLSNIMKDISNLTEYVPRMLQKHKTMEIAGPHNTRLPAKEELNRDWAIILGMILAGMAKAGVYVGYLYLFWLDFPLKGFRTTALAIFWVATNVPAELAAMKVVDIGKREVIVLIALQLSFIVLHFVSSTFLYNPKFNFRSRPD